MRISVNSLENLVSASSQYFNYTPSLTAKNAFFYPLCTGHFHYKAGYSLHRNSFDSFLLMYIESGELTIQYTLDGKSFEAFAKAGDFIILDCYQPHGYCSEIGWKSLWIHFDGPMARIYYELLVRQLGVCFNISATNAFPYIIKNMESIFLTFAANEIIREAHISRQFTNLFTDLLLSDSAAQYYAVDNSISYNLLSTQYNISDISLVKTSETAKAIEIVLTYLNEHFADNSDKLTIETLAQMINISPYHFIRLFKERVGFTPHEYLVHIRINNAKYMLLTTMLSVKDISYNCGYSSESVFCAAFKKKVGMTPAQYRASLLS